MVLELSLAALAACRINSESARESTVYRRHRLGGPRPPARRDSRAAAAAARCRRGMSAQNRWEADGSVACHHRTNSPNGGRGGSDAARPSRPRRRPRTTSSTSSRSERPSSRAWWKVRTARCTRDRRRARRRARPGARSSGGPAACGSARIAPAGPPAGTTRTGGPARTPACCGRPRHRMSIVASGSTTWTRPSSSSQAECRAQDRMPPHDERARPPRTAPRSSGLAQSRVTWRTSTPSSGNRR